jgi:hypothetical protein
MLYVTELVVCSEINKNQINTGVFEMIIGVLTTCHTQYT